MGSEDATCNDNPNDGEVMNHQGLVEWMAGSDTGMSSEFMAYYLGFGVKKSVPHYPLDVSDFGRCERLLRAVPTLRPLLPRMSPTSPIWAGLVEHWDELVAHGELEIPEFFNRRNVVGRAPRMYALMNELREVK